MKKGDVVRYAVGPTALLEIMHVDSSKVYGLTCCGNALVTLSSKLVKADAKDKQEWSRHAAWRTTNKLTGKAFATAYEKRITGWPPPLDPPRKKRKARKA